MPSIPSPLALLPLTVAYFASSAMMRVCDPMLPVLAQSFGVTTGQAALTVSSYAIAYGLMQLFLGPMGDRYGKRRVIGYAAVACIFGNLVALVALDLQMLVFARILAGACAAGIIPLVLAWIGDTVDYEERQAVLAKLLSASILGMISGQWVSGLLTDLFGWRSVFAVLAMLFCASGLAISLNREVRQEPIRTVSNTGHVQQILDVVRRPWARWILAMVAAEGAFAFSVMTYLPTYLVTEFGLGISWAAAIVVLYGVGGMVYSMAAKKLLERLGESGQSLAGGALMGLSWCLLAQVPQWQIAIPACTIAGIGYYMLHNTLTTHATQMAPELRGTAVGLYASALFIGIATGVSLTGLGIDSIGFRPVFMICGIGLTFLGAVFGNSLRLRHAATTAAIIR